MFSQNLEGVVYDSEAPVSGARIMNTTSKSVTSTAADGTFKIYAQVNDTLIFSSLFHHTKQFVINASHFSEIQVFELKKIVNELDEVEIQGSITHKPTDGTEATNTLNKQLKNDFEKHGYKYKKANTGPLDIMAIGESVVKLFKRKTPSERQTVETYISSDDFDKLFKKDKFFNDKFLLLDLSITKDFKHLFFAYCETKNIPFSLLLPDNSIYLIDHLLRYSEEFKEILKESKKH